MANAAPYLCSTCLEAVRQPPHGKKPSPEPCCFMCLGVCQTESFLPRVQDAIRQKLTPYLHPLLRFSFEESLMTFPADLLYRYVPEQHNHAAKRHGGLDQYSWAKQLKAHARTVLSKCLTNIQNEVATEESKALYQELPDFVRKEEQGHLSVVVVVVPKQSVVDRPAVDLPSKNKRRRKKRTLDDVSQGGSPHATLRDRLEEEGHLVWSIQSTVPPKDSTWKPRFDSERPLPADCLDIHVAVWRRPFYLRGCYTKNRRDVSQTPFVVKDQGVARRRGVTSVEEQIVPSITKRAGGISTINNGDESTNLVFGKCKFHASGREDMDVRMRLPDATPQSANITGRPFVCEATDAFRMLSKAELAQVVRDINHGETPEGARSYGNNPLGVGIAPGLTYCPSGSYKTLQEETENKVKFYGCYCWSEAPVTKEQLEALSSHFPLEIAQNTPIRVLHRRSSGVRVRHVLSYRPVWKDDHHFFLHISTTAGTYVKEFVHSDLGRTQPSMASLLGCRTDLLELDCEGIQMSEKR